MYKYITLIFFFHLTLMSVTFAQKMNYSIAFGDMGATMYPFQQVFNNTFFPYMKLSGEYSYIEKNKNTLFQAFDFNNTDHGTIGFISGLGTAGGYRYRVTSKFSVDLTLGIGFNIIFPRSKQFELNTDGSYSEKRPIFIKPDVSASFCFAYKLPNENQVFLRYGYHAIINYNRSVSVLPYEVLMLGYRFIR